MRKRFGLVAVCVLSLSVGAVASAEAAPQRTQAVVTVPSASAATTQFTLDADAVAAQAKKFYGDLYAGLKVTSSGIEISLKSAPSRSHAQAQTLSSPSVPVTVRPVQNSEDTLAALTARIADDSASLASRGIKLSGFGEDYTANKIQISLVQYNQAAADTLVATYGSNLVYVSPDSSPLPSRAGRTNDSAPWYGGDNITDHTTGDNCTGGFNVETSSGADQMITAAHCSGGTGSGSLSHSILNGSRVIGSIAARQFINNGDLDAELISTSSATGTIQAGPLSSPFTRTVVSVSTTDPIGGLICTDGAFSGEICGVSIVRTGYCQTFNDNVQTCGLVVSQRSGGDCVAGGDSGGPVETTIGSTQTQARGEIVGYGNGNTVCYYTPIRYITSQLHVSVLL